MYEVNGLAQVGRAKAVCNLEAIIVTTPGYYLSTSFQTVIPSFLDNAIQQPNLNKVINLGRVLRSPGLPSSCPKDALVVDDPGDDPDDQPGDGVCWTKAGGCTLRAAIQEANAGPIKSICFYSCGNFVSSYLSPPSL